MEQTNIISGTVTSAAGQPLEGLLVRALEIGLRSETPVGEARTDCLGQYSITLRDKRDRCDTRAALALAVLSPVHGALLYRTPDDALLFAREPVHTVDIVLSAPVPAETVEFDDIAAAVRARHPELPFHELEETDQHHDLTWLAGSLRLPLIKLEHFVLAHRIARASEIDPPFFYAVLRQDTLLSNDLATPFKLRQRIDSNTEPKGLLYEAVLTDPKIVERDVGKAVQAKLVHETVLRKLQAYLKALTRFRDEATAYQNEERRKLLVELVTQFVVSDRIGEAAALFQANRGDLVGVLKQVTNVRFLGSDARVESFRATLAIGAMVGPDPALIDAVAKQHDITQPDQLARLARLDARDWEAALGRLEVDPHHAAIQGAALARRFERSYPTEAFAARLARDPAPPIEDGKELAELLLDSSFDLRTGDVDLHLRRHRLDQPRHAPLRDRLKAVQRVFRLHPRYDGARALMARGLTSAHGIHALGRQRFVDEVAAGAGLSPAEAQAIYRKAESSAGAAMILAGELQDLAQPIPAAAAHTDALDAILAKAAADFPNLKTLFTGVDACACVHCRSVYSPAAYLVELLEFVDKRSVTDLTHTPPVTTNAALDVLFARRPDLADIDLSCENANTPLPYIDLVNELLEQQVAPDPGIGYNGPLSSGVDPLAGAIAPALLAALSGAGIPITGAAQVYPTEVASGSSAALPHYIRDQAAVVKAVQTGPNQYQLLRLRQTLAPAEELAAAPAYLNGAAYALLAASKFAFGLPFDAHHSEARAYFARFDIDRADLMRTFAVGALPAPADIDAETLGLTTTQRTLIATADAAGQFDYWNLPLADLKVVGVFLDKTGLTYAQLDELLSFSFIDPAATLFIKHLDLSCDLAQKEIAGLDDPALDRIHRLLRLHKATGWPLAVVHGIVAQPGLGAGALNDATLAVAATLARLSTASGIPLAELLGCFGVFPDDLYAAVFLNKARNGVIDPALLPEAIDGSGFLATVAASVALALQLKHQDFDLLLALLVDNKLTIANLSRLFLFSRLMRKLGLTALELSALIDLTGIDPTASPADALAFAGHAATARTQRQKLADVRFTLYHNAETTEELERREIKDATIAALLENLQDAYQAAFAQHRSGFNPGLSTAEQHETLLKALATIDGVTPDAANAVVALLERDWASAADAHALVDALFTPLFDTAAIHSAIDDLDAVPPAGDISAESAALLKAILDSVALYGFSQAQADILIDALAAAFKTDPDLTQAILARALLEQPAPGTAAVAGVLLGTTLIDTVNAVPAPPAVNEAAFPQHYQSLRLLHKLLPLARVLGLDPAVAEWLLLNAEDLGWFELDAIAYESGQTEASWEAYTDLLRMLALAGTLTPVTNPADAAEPVTLWTVLELTLPGSAATRDEFLEQLALLTGHEREALDAIDAHFFPIFSLAHYRSAAAWTRTLAAADYLRKLASPVADVVSFIKPTLTAIETAKLRMALKSRYDETTWLQTLKQVMDTQRPARRDALVAYLLATRPEFGNANDLYDQWLVDVEMSACMPSSRIVQAHNTIQLFVQRCLMGLEPEACANTDTDSGWQQWKWLSQYRVWEANMKVWCYPENWIEPELRDDKSFIFKELEDELLQNELTAFTAERALRRYLETLDGLAFLEVVATWYQVEVRTMHVFARTKGGDPATYYQREFQQERYWTPWVKVDLEITGDQLLAFSRNRRLHLAWPIFSEEPDPNPQAVVPNSSAGTVVNVDKPKRKLKIQLAVSELADGVWQPKRISKDAVRTPGIYTSANLEQPSFNLIYLAWADMVVLLKTSGQDNIELRGVFDIAGCKGYPELLAEGSWPFPDFFPDFKDTQLTVQRYREANQVFGDELAARTALSPFAFYDILVKTPGTFRLTYPHQMTMIDWIALLIQYLLLAAYGANPGGAAATTYDRYRTIKLPFGTLLPYFMEDSDHAYVITPGFYARRGDDPEAPLVRRTASDVFDLIDRILALYAKYMAKLKAGEPPATVLQELLADQDYQEVVAELKLLATLPYGEQFANMYHPLMCRLRATLYQHGVPGLMARATQLQQTPFDFDQHYDPSAIVAPPYPVEDVDFDSGGSYSGYNWELFFHAPLQIAGHLTRNQRFQEAMDWLHYIFNPTGALPGDTPQKYWVTKPFFLRAGADYLAQRIDTLLYRAADLTDPAIQELEFAVRQWRDNPFKPHVVARFRTVAYQKAVLMKYIDNLIAWGDNLFRQDSMESMAQATQMYILADKLLGPKPRTVPPVVTPPYQTYGQVRARLGLLGNALIDLENILPDLAALPEGGAELPPIPLTLSTLYFCVPPNDRMLGYWDTIADRLFKLRHCQNIDGIERIPALFAPPIDPGMLVRAAAAGLDLSAVIAGMGAPLPYYRFQTLAQKATELAQEVRNLGNNLLQALEKKDAEDLTLLRNELEIKLQNAIMGVKQLALEEANEQIGVLRQSRLITEERHNFYAQIEKLNDKEQLQLDKLADAHKWEKGSQISRTLAGVIAMVPDLLGGASGFGGSPHVTLQWGGKNLAAAANAAADVFQILSASAAYEANRASINGQHDRRFEDWKLQERQAAKELVSYDKQIAAAEIRRDIADLDMKNHALTIENNREADEFMRAKFTNRELYQWMVGQVSSVYFAAYKLAHDQARKAERAYQFELGRDDILIAFGYWDTLKKGLQCADRLLYDIKRMETGYLDQNKREYELTKAVSLALLDPLALVRLRSTGSCDFQVPEALFDLDHAGHYHRRFKAVALSMPCSVGPQTTVSARLSLTANRYRKSLQADNLAGTGYAEDPGNDERFVYNLGAIQSIATSSAQRDNGMFELNFRDERYLPFEGCGAISSWRLDLPKTGLAQFDYDSIADVVLHLSYTAREGGAGLRALAETDLLERLGQMQQELAQTGLHTLVHLKHELPNEWHQLRQNGSVNITLDKSRLPYLAQALDAHIENVVLLARVAGNPANVSVDLDGNPLNLARIDDWGWCKGETAAIALGTAFELALQAADQPKLQEIILVVKYGFS